jgi:5'-nucleotidase
MGYPIENMLVVGISGRALFDLSHEHAIFENEGLQAYKKVQREREDTPLSPGTAFHVAQGLLSINKKLATRAVEVVVISRNDGDSGLRIMNSIKAHNLDITRASFCGGRNAHQYFAAYQCKLFLSADEDDVRSVIASRGAAALMLPPPLGGQYESNEVRIAFDGDAVIFSDEAERVYQEKGLLPFHNTEAAKATIPLQPGPFKAFLQSLASIQAQFPADKSPIRTAVVTARNAPAHERAIRTLREWGITVDEMHFLGGIDKSGVLQVFHPHIFFDDQQSHVESCAAKMPAGQVLYGIASRRKPPASVAS